MNRGGSGGKLISCSMLVDIDVGSGFLLRWLYNTCGAIVYISVSSHNFLTLKGLALLIQMLDDNTIDIQHDQQPKY